MSAILVLVLVSILIAGGFLAAFIWAIRNGQYEDTFSPSVRMLFENPDWASEKDKKNAKQKENTNKRN